MKYPEDFIKLLKWCRKNCKSKDDILYGIRMLRTRPYSRLGAIIYDSRNKNLFQYYKGRGEKEVVEYIRRTVSPINKYKIVVYRGGSPIESGDWVALTPEYAEWHGTPVYQETVDMRDVVWAGTSVEEWYYIPRILKNLNINKIWRLTQKI